MEMNESQWGCHHLCFATTWSKWKKEEEEEHICPLIELQEHTQQVLGEAEGGKPQFLKDVFTI